jgi:hypothetical protein
MMELNTEIENKAGFFKRSVSFEALVAYYVFSGLVKTVMEYYEIDPPFDITVVLIGLIFLSVMAEWLNKKGFLNLKNESVLLISLFILFYGWMAISLIYTPSQSYAYEKVFKSLTNVIFVIIILRGNFNTSRFFKISFILVVIMLLWFLPLRFLYISGQSPKGYWFTREIMGLYLHISMPLKMILIYYLTSKNNISNKRVLNLLLYGIAIIGMLLLGARGPILIFVIIYLIYFILNGKIRVTISRKYMLYTVLALFTILLFVFIFREEFNELLNLTFERFKLIFSGLGSSEKDFGSSINGRLEYIYQATRIIFGSFSNFLIGAGIGSFGILTIGQDIRLYPHNFVLEIWCELGLVGILIFLSIVFISIRKIRFHFSALNIFPVFYILLNFMKSGSLADMRLLFTVLAVYFITSYQAARQ